jgi:hypothetical protein
MLRQVYGKEDVSRACVSQRCKWFSRGRDEIEFDGPLVLIVSFPVIVQLMPESSEIGNLT